MASSNIFHQCPYQSSILKNQTATNSTRGGSQQDDSKMTSRNLFHDCPYKSSIPQKQATATYNKEEGNQQDDHLKDFYMKIVNDGLICAYKCEHPTHVKPTVVNKKVIVVGAGASGLAAAYELVRAGFEVTILELQYRVGGRMKTIRDGFTKGLQAEGGAMRIPPTHYLVHAYIKEFNIALRPFKNYNDETYMYIDKQPKIKTKEWEQDSCHYSTLYFPGWDESIDTDMNTDVQGLADYYNRTVKGVKADLDTLGWDKWVEKYSKYSVYTFLREDANDGLRPWPEIAIRGLQITKYSPSFNASLVEHLRDEVGKWWEDPLQTPVEGMQAIAEGFASTDISDKGNLFNKIRFGIKVEEVKKRGEGVIVKCRNTATGEEETFEGDTAIVTVPLTILRQMDVDMETKTRRAVGNVHYQSSSKVLLQCRTRFWENDVGFGGFTITDMPIGQIHYPSPNNPPEPNPRGILLCYTWSQDALIFGSQPEKEAVASAVKQIAKIHPEMEDEFEVGKMQAWCSDPSAQGAYVLLEPYQYNYGMKQLMKPHHPIHLAGEAISYSNGWIQGAIESGLRAAYQLYSYYQEHPVA